LSIAANAEGQLKFNTTSLTAKAGKVSINFSNPASLEHNLTVASASGAVVGSTPTFQGGSKTASLDLKPGTYKFYCSVPGHRAGGMEGTLTVQ
jgi:plastocyanin